MGKDREYICQSCGQPFISNKGCKTRIPKYCSRKCAGVGNAKIKVCAWCGKEYYNWTRKKYCSRECAIEALRGVPLPKEQCQKISEARKASIKCRGENLYNWKGGRATYAQRMNLHSKRRRSALKMPLDADYLRLLNRLQRNKCFYCGCDMGTHPSLEHLTPVSKGGDNHRWNLVYACQSCNSKKHNKTLEEYAIKIGSLFLVDKYDLIIARLYVPYMQMLKNR